MNLAFGRGLDQRGAETTLAPGFVRDVVNLDIAPGQYAQKVPLGHARTRIGRTLVTADAGLRGGWCDPRVGFALLVSGTTLMALFDDGALLPVADGLDADSRVCAEFVPEAGAVFWSAGSTTGRIVDGVAAAWGLPDPAAPSLSSGAGGVLRAGTYQVAVSLRAASGLESALSPVTEIAIADDGALLSVTVPALPAGASSWRVYMSARDGDGLYWSADFTGTSTVIDADAGGRMAGTRFHARFPACQTLCHWHGRMWGGLGALLVFSAIVDGAPALHLIDAAGGYFPFDAPVRMIAPVLDGLYIGTDAAVWFLAGTEPADLRRVRVDGAGVLGHLMIPASAFPLQAPEGTDRVPAWVSADGEVIVGRAGGMVQRLTQDTVSARPGATAALAYLRDGRGERLVASMPSAAAAPWTADTIAVASLLDNGIALP